MAYNYDVDASIPKFLIKVDSAAKYGYFEHVVFGDACGGGLWFEKESYSPVLTLTDYDGTFALPKAVIRALRDKGFIVPPDFE
jgi:hypothetical protein